jgi:hypothetical protein
MGPIEEIISISDYVDDGQHVSNFPVHLLYSNGYESEESSIYLEKCDKLENTVKNLVKPIITTIISALRYFFDD